MVTVSHSPIHYSLLNTSEKIMAEKYCHQIVHASKTGPRLVNIKSSMLLHHNAILQVSLIKRKYLKLE